MAVAGGRRVSISAAVKESSPDAPKMAFAAVVAGSVVNAMSATNSPALEVVLVAIAARLSMVEITGCVTVATVVITGWANVVEAVITGCDGCGNRLGGLDDCGCNRLHGCGDRLGGLDDCRPATGCAAAATGWVALTTVGQ